MILGEISNLTQISTGNELLNEALRWVAEHHKDAFEKGTLLLNEEGTLRVDRKEVAMLPQQMLEVHRRHIDIHIPLSNSETFGWASTKHLRNNTKPYDEATDVEYFGDEPQSHITVHPGQCIVFFPEDAHAPNIGVGRHRKYCVKIAID
jgi:YhcH/YjgK/YiaL family protein